MISIEDRVARAISGALRGGGDEVAVARAALAVIGERAVVPALLRDCLDVEGALWWYGRVVHPLRDHTDCGAGYLWFTEISR